MNYRQGMHILCTHLCADGVEKCNEYYLDALALNIKAIHKSYTPYCFCRTILFNYYHNGTNTPQIRLPHLRPRLTILGNRLSLFKRTFATSFRHNRPQK